MNILDSVFKNKKIIYFLLVAFVIGGVYSFDKLSKLEDPEITVMVANVVTVYPGASAHEVEMQVTDVLEQEISVLADINKLQSRSEANVSIITVELEMTVPQKEIPQRWDFLRKKVELAIPKLPQGVQTPMIIDDIGDVYGMFYAIIADDAYSYKDMSDYADLVERNMLEVEGVRKVSIYGEQKPEILITVSADKLSEMGITPLQIFSALNDQTKALYAGNLVSGQEQIRVSLSPKSGTVEDIKNIYISGIGEKSFKLDDIATVEMGYNDPLRNTLHINNQKAVGIAMSMESGENIVKVGARVEKKLEEIKKQIPLGITFEKVFFQPEKVSHAINGFMLNLILSVVIVILVLMFTMGFRGGLIIGSGLLLTILITFPFLLAANGTLQRISLGAFIVAMGMLVDNAIVVLDGILIERSKGNKGIKSYTKTAKQTAIPLLGATLIAIAAFFPVYLSPDTAGTYVRDLFVVLAISLFISWVLALTQVPLFASLAYKDKNKKDEKEPKELYQNFLYRTARKIINFSMHHRFLMIAISFVVLGFAIFGFKYVDQTFFPDFNYNQCYIEHTLPRGSTPEMVKENLKKITDHFNTYDEVEMVVTSHGMTPMRYSLVRGMMTENADNYGELIVNFKDYKTMQKMQPVFTEYLHKEFPEAMSRIRKYTLNVKSTHSIEAEFTGPDPAVLKSLSKEVQDLMLQNPHVDKYTICDDWSPKAKTMHPVFSPIDASRTMSMRNDISNSILAATDGLPIAKAYEGETAYQIRFRVRDKDGNRIEDMRNIPVWNSIPNINPLLETDNVQGLFTGATKMEDITDEVMTAVPLSALTKRVELDWEEPVVRRQNGKRVIQAQCEPLPGFSPELAQAELDKKIKTMALPEGYEFAWVGSSELKSDGLENIFSFLPLAGGIILLILMLLFNDYRRPLIIILCLPMTVIGIVFGLIVMGQPFSFVAVIGAFGLAGMIIKNAIVLLDEIEVQLKENKSPYLAIVDATISRVRPVIMASLTTILGMMPLLWDPMYASMAVAIISGLIVGTLITLLFVPMLYSVFYRVNVRNR